MDPLFNRGQQVMIRPAGIPNRSPRDSALEKFSGKIGKVVNYYSISPEAGKTFFIYNVRFIESNSEVVLHEDEMKPVRK